MSLADDLTEALRNAPDLSTSPGLALTAATSGDPAGAAQALAHAGNIQAAQGATDDLARRSGGHSLLGSAMGFVSDGWRDARHVLGGAAGGAFKLANMPLQEAQHQYRYAHDIIARHGLAAGVLELGVLAAGATAGVLLAPETFGASLTITAGVLGAEAALGTAARVNPMHADSWAATTDGEAYRDPHDGQAVSPGRDLADVLGLTEHKGLDWFSVVSAVGDGLFDLKADPTILVGKVHKGVRAAKLAINSVEDVDRLYQADRGVRAAFTHMATLDAGEVPLRYPKFASMAERIGEAKTADEVADAFKEGFAATELTSAQAPTRSVLSALGVRAKVAGQEAQGPITWAKAMLGQLPEEAPEGESFLANVARKLGNNVPTHFKTETGEQIKGAFDVLSPDAVRVVHATLRAAGAPNRLAEDVATTFASTRSVAQRIRIYKNAVVEAVLSQLPDDARALAEDSEFIRNLRTAFDDTLEAGTEVGRAEQYGHDLAGNNLSKVLDADGGTLSAGILAHHVGLTAIPNYDAVRTLVRAKSGFHAVLGKTDDFFNAHFTGGIFKPLVLLQPGTGMRIGGGEAIQGVARFGLGPYAKTLVQRAVTGMRGPRALEGALGEAEASGFEQAMGRLAGGIEKLARVSDEEAEEMAKFLELTGGNRVPASVRAGHAVSEDLIGRQNQMVDSLYRSTQDIPKGYKLGDAFGEFGQDDARQVWHWQAWLRGLSVDEGTRKAAKAYLRALKVEGSDATEAAARAAKAHWDDQPAEVLERYHRHFNTAVVGADPHTEWGQVIAENLKGATHTPDGAPNVKLLRAIADGKLTTRQELEKIATLERPHLVPGRELVPDMGGTIEKVASWGHRRFVEPIVNTFAREPLYFQEWKAQYQALTKGAVAAGDMGDLEAMQFAAVRAAHKMRPLIHNPLERSLFSRHVQNLIPFYFAQEQAYRRVGRLLVEDPAAFRRAQLGLSALHDIAHPAPGDDGQAGSSSIMMPGTGFLGKSVPGVMNILGFHTLGSVPVGFAGSLQSLQTVSPLVEDLKANFGPLAVFTGKTFAHIFPEQRSVVDKIFGEEASAGSAWDTLIPNTTLRRVIQAQRMDSRSNQAAMMNIIQLESFRQEQATAKWIAGGSQGPEPRIVPGSGASAMERQEFLDRVKNHTRILDFVKAAVGFVSPMSPSFRFGDTNLSEDLRKTIREKGNLGEAINAYLDAHPDATPYTVFQSEAADGSPIQASHPAQTWIKDNLDLVHKYPAAAFFLVPQAKANYDAAIYNEQLAMGLRRKRTPEEFLKEIYVAQGNHDFFTEDRPAYTKALVEAKGDKAKTALIKANWQEYVAAKAAANPVWYDDYTSSDRQNRQTTALSQLQQMYADGAAPEGPQSEAVAGLLADHAAYQAASLPGRRDPRATHQRKALDIRWEQYLDGLVTEQPELSPIVNRLFRSMTEADRLMAGIGEKVA